MPAAAEEPFFLPEELEEIRRTFFDQGRSALESLAQEVLALEGEKPSPDRLRPLRRAAHTLKSDFASVGFPALSGLSHALEDALLSLERWVRPVSARQTDLLLGAVDALRAGLEAGARGDAEPAVDETTRRLAALGDEAACDRWDRLTADVRRTLAEGRTRGLMPVRVLLSPGAGRRNRQAVLAEAVTRLGLTVVTQEGEAPLEVFGLCAGGAQALLKRSQGLRGVTLAVEELPELALGPSLAVRAVEVAAAEGETVRIEARRVDEVLNLVGEMVIARSTIAGVAEEIEGRLPDELGSRLSDALVLLGRVLQDLQRSAMRMRMVPADRVFRRFSRVVRDLGRKSGKRLCLRIEGETTELDRGILDALEEPLLHLVRNAVDHGIETPAERLAQGKPEEAQVLLRAGREGNQIVIEVRDDGRGMDALAIKERSLALGLLSPQERDALSDDAARQLVFSPGLSTARQVTETSGRGVGLDVVRGAVEALKGSVRAENNSGPGAAFLIRVPLTVAIIQALLFRVGGRHLAVPLPSVVEIARQSEVPIQPLQSGEVFRLRGEVLGLLRLPRLLGFTGPAGSDGYVLVLQCGAGRFGVAVDALDGEQELVIKAVHDRWIKTPLVAGASVLGGGTLVLILDVPALYRTALSHGGLS